MRNILFLIVLGIVSVGCSQDDKDESVICYQDDVKVTDASVTCNFTVNDNDGFHATETCSDKSTSKCVVTSYCGDSCDLYNADNTECSAKFVRTEVACDSGNVYSWNTLIPQKM